MMSKHKKRKPLLALRQNGNLARRLGERCEDLSKEFFPGEES